MLDKTIRSQVKSYSPRKLNGAEPKTVIIFCSHRIRSSRNRSFFRSGTRESQKPSACNLLHDCRPRDADVNYSDLQNLLPDRYHWSSSQFRMRRDLVLPFPFPASKSSIAGDSTGPWVSKLATFPTKGFQFQYLNLIKFGFIDDFGTRPRARCGGGAMNAEP
jgi:hypothetical protein